MTDWAADGLPADLACALATVPVRDSTTVDGCEVAWLAWGRATNPPVLFVHGGAAHSWWWSFTAPLLADQYYVLAMDLSGHGDSGHRERYSFDQWATEIDAVLATVTATGVEPPVVVAHSMGGLVAASTAARGRSRLGELVIVDAPLSNARDTNFGDESRLLGRRRHYPTEQDAVERFRPLPRQPVMSDELVAHIARHSVRFDPRGGGWTWKFDPVAFANHPPDRPAELWSLLRRIDCPLGVVVAERSPVVIDADRMRLRQGQLADGGRGGLEFRVVDGGHHLMLDRPVELIATIRELLTKWNPNGREVA